MQSFAEALKAYTRDHPFDSGNGDSKTVLDQLYQAYAESQESDPPEISEGFKALACFLETLPLSDNKQWVVSRKLCKKVLTSTLGRIIIKIPSILVKNILLYGKKGEL